MTDEAGYRVRGAICLGTQRSLVAAILFMGWLFPTTLFRTENAGHVER